MITHSNHIVPAVDSTDDGYKELKIGFILLNSFTLIPVAGMLDGLRFAADESFNSQQKMCSWQLMTLDNKPVTASCGMMVTPTAELNIDQHWDYLVIAGGLLNETRYPPTWLLKKLQFLAKSNRKIISLCSGIFVLAKAGLLNNKRCAIHFTTIDEFKSRFPRTKPIIDTSYLQDGNILTCPGGTAIELVTDLITKHCGQQRAIKSRRYLLADRYSQLSSVDGNTHKSIVHTEAYKNQLVSRVIDYLLDHLSDPISATHITNFTSITLRKINQEFIKSTGMTLNSYWRKLKLDMARQALNESDQPISTIAQDFGFSNASHFIKWFKKSFGETPGDYRQRTRRVERLI